MLKTNRPLTSFNDGVVKIYQPKDVQTSFGAKLNPTSVEDLDFVVKLHFSEKSCRIQDFDFASRQGFALERKVEVQKVGGFDTTCCALIGKNLYGISYMDVSDRSIFLFLEGGAPIE